MYRTRKTSAADDDSSSGSVVAPLPGRQSVETTNGQGSPARAREEPSSEAKGLGIESDSDDLIMVTSSERRHYKAQLDESGGERPLRSRIPAAAMARHQQPSRQANQNKEFLQKHHVRRPSVRPHITLAMIVVEVVILLLVDPSRAALDQHVCRRRPYNYNLGGYWWIVSQEYDLQLRTLADTSSGLDIVFIVVVVLPSMTPSPPPSLGQALLEYFASIDVEVIDSQAQELPHTSKVLVDEDYFDSFLTALRHIQCHHKAQTVLFFSALRLLNWS